MTNNVTKEQNHLPSPSMLEQPTRQDSRFNKTNELKFIDKLVHCADGKIKKQRILHQMEINLTGRKRWVEVPHAGIQDEIQD
jgi:hypothetical protein